MSENFLPNIDYYALDSKWLLNRMLFIAGPRQVGKTTYAQKKIQKLGGSYYNWDDKDIRAAYEKESGFFVKTTPANSLVVFDEIHKRKKWKDILKGIYDVHKSNYQFLISGSAQLDTFRRSGDSLVGRYFLTHMFPISVGDLLHLDFQEFTCAQTLIQTISDSKTKVNGSDLESLIKLGGFPQPYFSGSESVWRRWQKQHQELLVREDLRDLSNVQDLDNIENLIGMLKTRVASTVSRNSIAGDLEVDSKTIKQWITQLEKIMLVFSIQPWHNQIQKTIRKNPKIYFYDWSCIDAPGPKFENFIAAQLFKAVTLWNDRFGYNFDLHFIRTYNRDEVDFCITLDSKPWLLIETKHGYPEASKAIYEFSQQLKIPAIILTNEPNWNTNKNGIYILDCKRFLGVLP